MLTLAVWSNKAYNSTLQNTIKHRMPCTTVPEQAIGHLDLPQQKDANSISILSNEDYSSLTELFLQRSPIQIQKSYN